MDKSTVLNCPFCGGIPTVNSRANGYAEVGCEPCGVWTSSSNSDEHLTVWNRRALASQDEEPTMEMIEAGDLFFTNASFVHVSPAQCVAIYKAMRSAAPGEGKR